MRPGRLRVCYCTTSVARFCVAKTITAVATITANRTIKVAEGALATDLADCSNPKKIQAVVGKLEVATAAQRSAQRTLRAKMADSERPMIPHNDTGHGTRLL